MRYLIILSISLLLFSCEGNNISPADSTCDIKISHNDKSWDVIYCGHSTRYTEGWRFRVQAERIMHRRYQYVEEISFFNIPYKVGKYDLE